MNTISSVLNTFPLLAQTRIEAMNQAFLERETTNGSSGYIMLIVVIWVLLTGLGILWLVKRRTDKIVRDSRLLFSELCRAHQLSWSQRGTLVQLARHKKLSDPVSLFLQADLWTSEETPSNESESRFQKKVCTLKPLLFSPSKSAAAAQLSKP